MVSQPPAAVDGVRSVGLLLLAFCLLGIAGGERALDVLRGGDPAAGAAPRLCSFRARTGVPCLGCGGTRALGRMARGDWRGALAANPLGAFAGAALWGLAAAGAAAAWTGAAAWLRGVLALLVALTPGAFLWNVISWWLMLGSRSVPGP